MKAHVVVKCIFSCIIDSTDDILECAMRDVAPKIYTFRTSHGIWLFGLFAVGKALSLFW